MRKINVTEALKMRNDRGMNDTQIAKHFDCSQQSVNTALKKFKKKPKIDTAKALQLRHTNGLTDAQIAKHFDCTRQSVQRALKRFNKILLPASELQAYQEKKAGILESVEATLVCDLADTERRRKASLNNTAYALSQVANMTRLEKGLSTSNVAYVDMSNSLEEIQQQRKQLEETLADL